MNNEEILAEMYDQDDDELFFDDSTPGIVDVDYTTQSQHLSNTNQSAARPVDKVAHYRSRSSLTCAYNRCMTNKALLSNPQTLQDLQDFMFDTMMPAEMCVDWFCDRFNVNATDEVIDFVVDAHFGMFADQ